jgi:aspartate kinase
MARIVLKFGGTSVGDTDRIKNVASKVKAEVERGNEVAVVVSAMSGKTNELVGWCRAASALHDAREYDTVVASGEQVTSGLLAITLEGMGINARSWQGWQLPILTDNAHGGARILEVNGAELIKRFKERGEVAVIAGFQGIHKETGRITTLGRGGSDTSAVAVAAAVHADRCDIYTDVDGVYTTDPRIVPRARKLDRITFEEMLELASQGSKVLQIRSVEFAGKYRVPLRVLSSFTPWDIPIDEEARSGTLITFEEDEKMEQAVVSGIAFNRDEAKISLMGVTDKPGIAHMILGPVAEANIDVDVIIQNVSHDGRTDFSFTVHRNDYARTMELMKSDVIPKTGAAGLVGDDRICKVSIVGIGMRSHVGVASRMFAALSEEGINIQMITTSEIKTSVVIDEKYMELAVRALHKAFDLDQVPASA